MVIHCRSLSGIKFRSYNDPDLLILDELGFKKMPGHNADDLFEVISKRYEKGSVIITSNKNFDQWADIFADSVLPSAVIDRIAYHSVVIKINGQSYRTKTSKRRVVIPNSRRCHGKGQSKIIDPRAPEKAVSLPPQVKMALWNLLDL